MTNSIRTWAVALAFLAGCSTPTDKLIIPAGDPVLLTIETTGAVVGSTGKIRVILGAPVGKEAAVDLTSSDATVASFPSTLKVQPGALAAEGEFTGVSAGAFVVTAKVAGSSMAREGAVVTAQALTELGGPNWIAVGETATGYAGLNLILSADATVTLSSSNPAIVVVPPTATAPAFDRGANFTMKGVAKGTATISASFQGQVRTMVVTVADAASSVSLSTSPSWRALKTQATTLRIQLQPVPAVATTVQLAASPSTVATVPATVVVPAAAGYAEVPVSVVGSGTVTFTATVAAQVVSTAMTFVDTLAVSNLWCSDGPVGRAPCNVSLTAAAPADTTVAVSVPDHPDVVDAPATVVVPAGSSQIAFAVTGLKAGSATIIATLLGSLAVDTMTIGSTSFSLSMYSPATVQSGNEILISVYSASSAPSDVQLTVTSDNPAVFAPPASALLTAGNNYTTIAGVAKAAGYAVITVTGGGATATVIVQVGASNPSLPNIYVPGGTYEKGWAGCISVNGYFAASQTVNVSTSVTNVMQAAAMTAWPANQWNLCIPYRAIGAGTGCVTTAWVGGASQANTANVVDKASVSSVGASASVSKGGTLSIYMNATVAADTIVTLAQTTGTGRLTLPATVTVPTGSQWASVSVTAPQAGTTTVTATANGLAPVSTAVTVGP
jgi:hypothetical protein